MYPRLTPPIKIQMTTQAALCNRRVFAKISISIIPTAKISTAIATEIFILIASNHTPWSASR